MANALDLPAARTMVARARAAYARMCEIDMRLGGLAVEHPDMADDLSSYDDDVLPFGGASLPERLLAEVDRLREALAEVAKHQEDMADSLDDSVTPEQVHEQLLIGMHLARDAREPRS